jgi:hypothetical protein
MFSQGDLDQLDKKIQKLVKSNAHLNGHAGILDHAKDSNVYGLSTRDGAEDVGCKEKDDDMKIAHEKNHPSWSAGVCEWTGGFLVSFLLVRIFMGGFSKTCQVVCIFFLGSFIAGWNVYKWIQRHSSKGENNR